MYLYMCQAIHCSRLETECKEQNIYTKPKFKNATQERGGQWGSQRLYQGDGVFLFFNETKTQF